MSLIFGPGECYSVLKTIFDSCVNCSFQPTLFQNRIREIFSVLNEEKKCLSTEIKCNFIEKNFRENLYVIFL